MVLADKLDEFKRELEKYQHDPTKHKEPVLKEIIEKSVQISTNDTGSQTNVELKSNECQTLLEQTTRAI